MTSAEGGSQGNPANSGQGDGGTVQAQLFTQDAVNSIAARERKGALQGFFKELGFEQVPDANTLKETLTKATEFDKQQEGQKGDVQRLTDQLNAEKQKSAEVPTLKTTILQQRIAADEKLPTRFWKYVEGSTDDEIKESIKGIKAELGLADDGDGDGGNQQHQQQGQQQGARPPAPNQQQGRTSGGGSPAKTLSSGAEAYARKHAKKE